jgi:hypothetical protein
VEDRIEGLVNLPVNCGGRSRVTQLGRQHLSVEVLIERICRDNGVTTGLTKPR